MDTESLNKANLENLTLLWRRMGADRLMPGAYRSHSWPHRLWAETHKPEDVLSYLQHADHQTILPLWECETPLSLAFERQLRQFGWQLRFEQTAMWRDLTTKAEAASTELQLMPVMTAEQADLWTTVSELSFAYAMDRQVIRGLLPYDDIHLLTAYRNRVPVGTALLFFEGDCVGVHQVGVLPDVRGQGIAYAVMQQLIALSRRLGARRMLLQASESGQGVYRRLGFANQFRIKNYGRSIS